MKNIFKENRQKRYVEGLDEKGLDREINEKTQELESLKRDIKNIKKESKTLSNKQEERVAKLQEELEMYIEALKGEEDEITREINKLYTREEKYTANFKKSQKEIDDKVALLVEQRKALLQKEKNENVKKSKKRDELEAKLEELKEYSAKEQKRYEDNITKLEKDLDELKTKNRTAMEEAEHELKIADEKGKEKIAKLEKKRQEMVDEHHQEMETLVNDFVNHSDVQSKELRSEVNDKRENLNDLLNKLEETKINKAKLERDLENRRRQLDSEFEEILRQNQTAKNNALMAKEALQNELYEKEAYLELTISKEADEFNKKTQDLDDLIDSFKTIRIETLQANNDELGSAERDLKQKYTQYVGHLNEQFLDEKKAIEAEIDSIEDAYKTEEEELSRQISYLKAQFNNIKNTGRTEIADMQAHTDAAKNELVRLKEVYEIRVKELNDSIAVIKKTNDVEAKAKVVELRDELNKRKDEYQESVKQLNAQILEIEQKVSSTNKDIEDVEDEARSAEEEARVKVENVKKEQEDYLNHIEEEKKRILQEIQKNETYLNNEKDKHERDLLSLENKRSALIQSHESEMSKIRFEFEGKIAALNEKFKDDCNKASDESNEKFRMARAQADDEIQKLAAEHEQYKIKSEDKKNEINNEIASIRENVSNKINAMQAQQAELIEKIDEVKTKHNALMESLRIEKANIEAKHVETMNKIKQDHEAALAEMEEDSKQKLLDVNQKVSSTNDILTAKKIELENYKNKLASERQSYEDRMKQLILENDARKAKADSELAEIQQKLSKTIELNRIAIEDFNNELSKRRQTNLDFVREMDKDIEALKLQKESARYTTAAELEAKLNAFITECNEKEEEFRKQCEFEVQAKRDELKIKQDALDKAIYAIKQNKYQQSGSLEAQYQAELSKANQLEQDYNELQNRFEMERIDLNKQIETTRAHNDEEIKLLREDNQALVELKLDEYRSIIKAQIEKQKVLEEDIRRVANEIEIKTVEFKQIKLENEQKLAESKEKTDNYLKEIAERIAGLVSQEYSLNQAHEEKLEALFNDIADAKEEYDTILKAKPVSLRGIEDESNKDIEEATQEFRNRFTAAELAFKDVIGEIEAHRNEMLDKIGNEIEELINSQRETLSSYESDVIALSTAYERMIKDEQHRQKVFTEKISDIRESSETFKSDSNIALKVLKQEFTTSAEELGKSLKDQLSSIATENDETIANELEKQKRLNDKLDEVNNRYAELKERYAIMDEQLARQKALLVSTYQKKLESVKLTYTKALEAQRARFQNIDFMSDEIFDIFKKNQA